MAWLKLEINILIILQNKIIRLTEIIAKVPLDVLCVDETKSDDSFSNSQFVLENFVGIETQKEVEIWFT